MQLSLLVVLLVPIWGHEAASVPDFLKYIADQKYSPELGLLAPGSWHPTALSVAPFNLISNLQTLSMKFLVPNDEWSLKERRGCTLVFSLVRGSANVTVTVTGGGTEQPWQLSKRVTWAHDEFLLFNLTENVDPRHQKTLTLSLKAWNDEGHPVAPADAVVIEGLARGPLLLITELAKGVTRLPTRPRRVPPHRETITRHEMPGCQLEDWGVTARQLGWNNLVYPTNVSLNLCVGQCPRPILHPALKPSSHALARNLFKSRNSRESFHHPDVQCVPISFNVMQLILEVDEGVYSVVASRDLSAGDCGCR
ncbi:uncharacterized protein LOC132193053 [Neocloeon triangulifer]|uniref:uncharacterized protein LOC132193053 n=1 Tax=Neocloeon triangulifer TaxID=2078957 RepID=UPI00286F3227|nr:uncharacterized protein LOC132193053 [Neocloeon triangulifer]